MREGILCQSCGIEAPSRYVRFHQNIGMLLMRQSSQVDGNICKSCLHKHYWSMTGTTLAIGWLGTISLVLAPIFIINNTIYYLSRLGMAAVPPGARPPTVDNAVIQKLFPHVDSMFGRLNGGEDLHAVAREYTTLTGTTPGQVVVYLIRLAESARQQPTIPQAKGFEVMPPVRQ